MKKRSSTLSFLFYNKYGTNAKIAYPFSDGEIILQISDNNNNIVVCKLRYVEYEI